MYSVVPMRSVGTMMALKHWPVSRDLAWFVQTGYRLRTAFKFEGIYCVTQSSKVRRIGRDKVWYQGWEWIRGRWRHYRLLWASRAFLDRAIDINKYTGLCDLWDILVLHLPSPTRYILLLAILYCESYYSLVLPLIDLTSKSIVELILSFSYHPLGWLSISLRESIWGWAGEPNHPLPSW
jgi:hypothetical protein